MLIPKTDRNPNLFLPAQIQPSPVEMEHVSTTPDIAKTVNLRGPVTLAGHCVTVANCQLSDLVIGTRKSVTASIAFLSGLVQPTV